eukprot:6493267-Heterocapsa_arctica.AAC.1
MPVRSSPRSFRPRPQRLPLPGAWPSGSRTSPNCSRPPWAPEQRPMVEAFEAARTPRRKHPTKLLLGSET